MKRSQFLKVLGFGTAAAVTGAGLSAKEEVYAPPKRGDEFFDYERLYQRMMEIHRQQIEKAYLYGHLDVSEPDGIRNFINNSSANEAKVLSEGERSYTEISYMEG